MIMQEKAVFLVIDTCTVIFIQSATHIHVHGSSDNDRLFSFILYVNTRGLFHKGDTLEQLPKLML